ncbi:uncharacterized protein LOC107044295 [Diachasma alloeum]|uniref:uncharacterized protein LOC107044295 n=1 Tax=Diachasma alloeum TaxID=454923 RepID=UPI00073811CD|nr:uncharacterized protein LOC107044295 [Diachasma alloeum]
MISTMSSPYKLELNLRQIAMVQTAINCWEQHQIKTKIKDFFLKHDSYTICRREAEEKIDWTCEILENVRQQRLLPDSMKDEMTYMITSIGDRMIEWLKYITEKLEGSRHRIPALEHYLDNIFWTNYGTIDAVKIFKSLCVDGKITDIPYMYEEACNYCLEEDIESLWKKSSLEDRDAISWKSRWNIGDECNVHLLVYWRWYISDRKSHLFIKSSSPHNYDEIYDFKHSAKANTFRLSAIGGYDVAVKYFYHQLSDDEKSRNLVETTEILLSDKILRSVESTEEDYTRRYIDILVFLMQKMTTTQRNELLRRHKDDILKMLLTNWPWQALFIPTLEQTWEFFSTRDFKALIKAIVEAILDEYELRGIKDTTTQCILFETWDKAPLALKKGVVKDCWLFFDKCLRIMKDITFTKYVINDPDLKEHRQQLLDDGKDYYYYLIIEKNYNVVEKIMEEVLYTDEERVSFKNKIDSCHICEYFILKCQYCSADKYLNWQFSTPEDRIKFKNFAKASATCSSIICDIWRENESIPQAKRESDIFFRWFLYEERDRETLRTQLQRSPKFLRILVRLLRRSNEIKFKELLDCCQFTQEEVDRLRTQTTETIKAEEVELQNRMEENRRLFMQRYHHFRFH